MSAYEILKSLHVLTVLISGGLFAYRVVLRVFAKKQIEGWLRVVPHINDSALLLLALSMLFVAHLNPLTQDWLLAKITALLIYIALGIWSLRAPTTLQCGLRAIPAALVFAYIIAVAISKSPAPMVP